jgi:hypothetical protein
MVVANINLLWHGFKIEWADRGAGLSDSQKLRGALRARHEQQPEQHSEAAPLRATPLAHLRADRVVER